MVTTTRRGDQNEPIFFIFFLIFNVWGGRGGGEGGGGAFSFLLISLLVIYLTVEHACIPFETEQGARAPPRTYRCLKGGALAVAEYFVRFGADGRRARRRALLPTFLL